jgi:hypothetical protein
LFHMRHSRWCCWLMVSEWQIAISSRYHIHTHTEWRRDGRERGFGLNSVKAKSSFFKFNCLFFLFHLHAPTIISLKVHTQTHIYDICLFASLFLLMWLLSISVEWKIDAQNSAIAFKLSLLKNLSWIFNWNVLENLFPLFIDWCSSISLYCTGHHNI